MFGDKEFGKNAGYPTPEATPEDMTCLTLKIPADKGWWAVFTGLLLTLTDENAWQQFEGGITREQAAHCALEIYLAATDAAAETDGCEQCFLPTGSRVLQLDELGRWRMLDNDEWVEPTGDYALPPPEPRTEPTDEEKRCLASANAANTLKTMYESVADSYNEHLGQDEAMTALSVAVVGLLLVPAMGVIMLALYELTVLLMAEAFAIAEFITEDVWTSDFDETLVCILFENSTVVDDVVLFDFPTIQNQITNALIWEIDFTLAQQRLALQVGYFLQMIGGDGLNIAGGTTAISSFDCPCGDVWCKRWYLSEGSHDGLTITVIDGSITGAGIESVTSGDSALLHVTMTLSPPCVPHHSALMYSTSAGGNGGTRAYQILNDGIAVRTNTLEAGIVTNQVSEMDAIDVEIDAFGFALDNNHTGGTNVMTWLELSGEGDCPYDNCDNCED